jgi:hypothetical protein
MGATVMGATAIRKGKRVKRAERPELSMRPERQRSDVAVEGRRGARKELLAQRVRRQVKRARPRRVVKVPLPENTAKPRLP